MSQTSVLAQVEKNEREELISEVERLEAILEKAKESGQVLKDVLLKAEQEKVALQERVAKLEADIKAMVTERDIRAVDTHSLAGMRAVEECTKVSLKLKLKCVEGERDRYKEERDKAEKEMRRLEDNLYGY